MAAGKKTGGRQKGTPNRATAALAAEIAESGLTPLAYMLSVMGDQSTEPATRLKAAIEAAPYVHPKLSAIQHTGAEGGPIEMDIPPPRQLAATLLAWVYEESRKATG
jgi:hypothetical protein